MKKDLILIFGMLCMLILGSCDNKSVSSNDNTDVDTMAIIKNYLEQNRFVDSSKITLLPPLDKAGKKYSIDGAAYIGAAAWMKGTGTQIPAADGFEQINKFIDGATYSEIRSFLVDKKVFADYFATGQTITHFKLCIALGRTGGVVDRHLRTMVVLAIDDKGKVVTIPAGAGKENVYDQIAPCPVDCPRAAGGATPKEVECDYVREATGKCEI